MSETNATKQRGCVEHEALRRVEKILEETKGTAAKYEAALRDILAQHSCYDECAVARDKIARAALGIPEPVWK